MKAQAELFRTEIRSLLGPVEAMIKKVLDDPDLSKEERAVAELLYDHWHISPLTQKEIARHKRWLGCHPKHEVDIVANRLDSTTRQVREIIRTLRVTRKLPILADRDGYYFPKDDDEAKAYIVRMEAEARARARSSIETYQAMRDALGITSALFEEMAQNACKPAGK